MDGAEKKVPLLSQAWDALDALGKRDEGENYAR